MVERAVGRVICYGRLDSRGIPYGFIEAIPNDGLANFIYESQHGQNDGLKSGDWVEFIWEESRNGLCRRVVDVRPYRTEAMEPDDASD